MFRRTVIRRRYDALPTAAIVFDDNVICEENESKSRDDACFM